MARTSDRNGRTDAPHAPAIDDMTRMSRAGMNAFGDVTKRFYEGWIAYNQEVMAFVSHRLREDAEMPKQLMACQGPQDVMRVYSEFSQKMIGEYMSEMEKLARIGGQTAGKAWSAVETHNGADHDDKA